MIGESMGGAWYESLRLEGLQAGEEENFRADWETRSAAKGRRKECPVEILEEMMEEEKWKNVRVKVVKVERENKNKGKKFKKMEEDRVGINEEEEEIIEISSSEEEDREDIEAGSDEKIEEIILSSGEEEEFRSKRKAERCIWCKSYGCRGMDTARQCTKCGHLTLRCWVAKHQKWCKTH